MDGNPVANRCEVPRWLARAAQIRNGLMSLLILIALGAPGGHSFAQSEQSAPVAGASPAYSPPSEPVRLPENQEGFYDVEQLERLFQIAKESGFGEEELKQITIEDEQGKTVNAWVYLQEMKRRRDQKDRAAQERLQKIYLTVQDVLADLRRREMQDLRDLRDKSVFNE